jgi:hypothetical protein
MFSLEPGLFFWVAIGITLVAMLAVLRLFFLWQRDPTGFVLINRFRRRRRGQVLDHLDRVKNGEELDEASVKNLTAEDRSLFEVALIDALTNWSPDDQTRLRSKLTKLGYDEQCARRSMSSNIADRVRASTLLNLLRPPAEHLPNDFESSPEDEPLIRVAKRQTSNESEKPGN